MGRGLRCCSPASILATLNSTRGRCAVAFTLIYLALVRYCSLTFYRDPTSAFFDPSRAYERSYSLSRQEKANTFLQSSLPASNSSLRTEKPFKVCVGVVSVKREGEQYVRSAAGSLLEGLTAEQRAEMYFTILIAHTAPHVHPVFQEAWLKDATDRVLLYDVNQQKFRELMEWEADNNYRSKAVFDYTYLLRHCLETGAEWIAMLEDDTIAVAGWYPRLLEALEETNQQRVWTGKADWLYLRMFYTEKFLGWNSEEWPRYLAVSVAITSSVALFLYLIRLMMPMLVSRFAIIAVSLIVTPLFIALSFLAGRLAVQPLRPGVSEMANYGCCGQGLVFSHNMAPKMINRLAQKRTGFVDSLIDEFADENGLAKLVVIPSLLQHVGAKTSKEDDTSNQADSRDTVAETIWNFGFEKYKVELA